MTILHPVDRARDSSIPDPIPVSYYARPDRTGRKIPDAWGLRRGALLLRSVNPLHLTGGVVLAIGLLLVTAVLALSGPSSPPAASRPASRPSRPPVSAAAPAPAQGLPEASPVAATPSPTPTHVPTPRPTPTRAAAPMVTFLNPPLSVHRGQPATLLVRTDPGVACSVEVGYQPAPALGGETATDAGDVSWTWKVSHQAPPGTWPIRVSCGNGAGSTSITLF
ncbi:MAG TPA: hypothetical protein VGO86_14705 [Candidatus Dormibacteraeota bacterium]|jgi:hypothetical protein